MDAAFGLMQDFVNAPPARQAQMRTVAHPVLDALALNTQYGMLRDCAANAVRLARPQLKAVCTQLHVGTEHLENGRWHPTNPSVLRTPYGYLVCIRLVNYTNVRASNYQLEADGVIRTRNVLQVLDKDGVLVSEHPLVLPAPWASDVGPFQGLEDIRLFVDGGVVALSATYAQLRLMPVGRMVRCTLALKADTAPAPGAVLVDSLVELVASPEQITEKNWSVCTEGGGVRWIYSLQPFRALRWNGKGVDVAESDDPHRTKTLLHLATLRGSTGVARAPSGSLLSLFHFYSNHEGRFYHHRWVEHDPKTLRPVRVSESFCFGAADTADVEFAAGLTAGHDGLLWVSYGVGDREAWAARVDEATVQALKWYAA